MKRNDKIQSVQGLRGIACLMVFFSHAFGAFGYSFNRYFTFLYDGSISVIIFFLLSGFLQYMSCKEYSINGYFNYLVRKMVRLYPVYIITLIIGMMLCNMELNFSVNDSIFSDWFANFWKQKITINDLLPQIPIIGKYDATLINPPIWTMYSEIQAIILLPILDFGYQKKKNNWIIYCALVVTAIFNTFGFFSQIVWKWLGVFLIGYAGKAIISNNKKFVNVFQQNKTAYIGIFLVFLIFEIRSTMPENLRIYLLAIFCMFLILIICYNDMIYRFCSFGWLVFFGNISYEFYLVHFIVLLSLRPLAIYFEPSIYIILALILSIIMSVILNRLICVPISKKFKNGWCR